MAGGEFFLLRVKAVPNAKKTQFAGTLGGAVKIKVQDPPEGGRANAELAAFVAGKRALPSRKVRVAAGETSRKKILRGEGRAPTRAAAAGGFPVRDAGRGNG